MLIPIFKPGDVLENKYSVDKEKILVLGSRTKSETTEYTADMDIGYGVTRHEIKTAEWTEYDVLTEDFRSGNVAEDDLLRWYRRVSHVDLSSCFGEKEAETKIEKLKITEEDLKQCEEVSNAYNKAVSEEKIKRLTGENEKLAKELDKKKKEQKAQAMKSFVLKIDAVSAMKMAGFSVEMTARVLDIPEAAVKVYLEAAGEFAPEE